jgi:hypothetical protein
MNGNVRAPTPAIALYALGRERLQAKANSLYFRSKRGDVFRLLPFLAGGIPSPAGPNFWRTHSRRGRNIFGLAPFRPGS